jgi:hypothetical protein
MPFIKKIKQSMYAEFHIFNSFSKTFFNPNKNVEKKLNTRNELSFKNSKN